MNKYKLAVFIGRFQPYHVGHKHVVNEALKIADNVLLVLGSSGEPRNIRNPYTVEERISFIRNSHSPAENKRIVLGKMEDFKYNDNKWMHGVQTIITKVTTADVKKSEIVFVGHSKDKSSYYLKIFPDYAFHEVSNFENIDATNIRENLFSPYESVNAGLIPSWDLSADTLLEPIFELEKEWKFTQDYKKLWEAAPFPVIFQTVDSVVTQSGKILLVKRGGFPGKGLYALPGGFLGEKESMLDSAIRELREETRLKVPEPVLKGSIKSSKTFDDVHRSSRGRTITTAFHFALNPDFELPKVKGSDDAEWAGWVDFADVKRETMYEDHLSIIDYFLGIY